LRRSAIAPTPAARPRWRRGRLNAVLATITVLLASGAIAAAATSILSGSPVRSEGEPPSTPRSGVGVPSRADSSAIIVRTADPAGGLAWGMRIVPTTRGEVCLQVGRIAGGELGELGIDGVFHNDGLFHPLEPNALPTYGTSSEMVTCVLNDQTIVEDSPSVDRSGDPVPQEGVRPPSYELRSISFGMLGPNALSVTYRTAHGLRTIPVSRGTGAFLVVGPTTKRGRQFELGAGYIGDPKASPVDAIAVTNPAAVVAAVTYRLGSSICSVGRGAPVSRPCPAPHLTGGGRVTTTRDLHEALHATAVEQTAADCRAAFLNDPCYRVLLTFRAPYAVANARTEYEVWPEGVIRRVRAPHPAKSSASCINTPIAGWATNRDIRRGELISTLSTSAFNPLQCGVANERLRVLYAHDWSLPNHAVTVVGTARLPHAARGRR